MSTSTIVAASPSWARLSACYTGALVEAHATAGLEFRSWLTDDAPSAMAAYTPLDTPCPRALFTGAFADLTAPCCPDFTGGINRPINRASCMCLTHSKDMIAAITGDSNMPSWSCRNGPDANLAVTSATRALQDLCGFLSTGWMTRTVHSVAPQTTSPTIWIPGKLPKSKLQASFNQMKAAGAPEVMLREPSFL